MKSFTEGQRRVMLLITAMFLFFIGLGMFLAGLIVKPTNQLKFLGPELGSIFIVHQLILVFGFVTLVVSIFGVYGFWAGSAFYIKYGSAILIILMFELVIIANYMITQRIQVWYINAEILEIAGSASFSRHLRQSNVSGLKTYFSEAENNMENLRNLHTHFECCSGYSYNKWKPVFPNYICCKKGETVPCSLENSYEDRCDRKLLKYAWKRYRYYMIICGTGFLLQSIVLGLVIILYDMELNHQDSIKKK